eukprot:COSAG01_NODE_3464_length_6063_cov_22.453219_3_plen_365_part_00
MPTLILSAWSRYSCELHHGLHSWVGAATDGGYLGSDARAFVSAVLSGAAGYYALGLDADAEISTSISILLGQDVRISSSSTFAHDWGSGSFTVQHGGLLALSGVALTGSLTVEGGSNATVSGGSLAAVRVQDGGTMTINTAIFGGVITVPSPGGVLILNTIVPPQVDVDPLATVTQGAPRSAAAVCAMLDGHYTTVSDAWRSSGRGGTVTGVTGDCSSGGTGVGGGRWYRFTGVGDALRLTAPTSSERCNTYPGWLSSWRPNIACSLGTDCPGSSTCGGTLCSPAGSYSGVGRYPVATEGVVEMTACFDAGGRPCTWHRTLAVVHCDGFLLWRLPYAPGCQQAYCTAASGISTGRRLSENTTEE